MSKQEPSIVYVFHGSSGAIPWSEIRRVIGMQFERDSALALTVTCGGAGKVYSVQPSAALAPSITDTGFFNNAKRPTMADVAREANVSTSTVSRVLNDYWSIGAETQKRVEAAMKLLDYRPNEAARTMVQSRRKSRGQSTDRDLPKTSNGLVVLDTAGEEARAASK